MQNPPIEQLYDRAEGPLREVLAALVPEAELESVAGEARAAFLRLSEEMPYADRRDHTMFDPTFSVFQWLAVHEALRGRGIDVHQLGREIMKLPVSPRPEFTAASIERILAEAEESQRGAAANEFVFEMLAGDEQTDGGMNVHSCAVCHAYARHDAMELVPYMCAFDDAESAAGDMGLRRTGTIALGAHRCDFRYKRGGEPLPLAPQYPGKIRLEP